MTSYLTRSFLRSNASFCFCNGNALQASVSHLRDGVFTIDAGLGSPRVCTKDELIGMPINQPGAKFENKVGYMASPPREKLLNKRILERMFVDIVAGDPQTKARTVARFQSMVGDSSDVVPGEPHLLLPRVYRRNRAWMELNKIWRTKSPVKGMIVEKIRGGYAVAIAGFVTFLPFRRLSNVRLVKDRFIIDNMKPKQSGRFDSVILF